MSEQQTTSAKKRKQRENETDANTRANYVFDDVMKMNPVEVSVLFARELSVTSTVLKSICAEISMRRLEPVNDSHQEAIVAEFVDMLTEPITLEIIATVSGKEESKPQIYLFGGDRPLYSFSLQCLRTNPTLSACIYVMLSTGYERQGTKYFNSRKATEDRSRIEYKDFLFNDILQQHFFRSLLLLHYVEVILSGIDIYFADQYPRMDVTQRSMVLLQRVINDVDSKLEQMKVAKKELPKNFETISRIVNTLTATEKTPQQVQNLISTVLADVVKTYPAINRL